MTEIIYGSLISLFLFILLRSEGLLAEMTKSTNAELRLSVFLVCAGSLSLGAYLLSAGSARYITAMFKFADRSECVFFGLGILCFVGGVALLFSERAWLCKTR